MQTEPNAKQQIVERIKNSTNILVTVGRDPSVDALSAALGLTMMLGKLDKHATAVFSGTTPPAITFLQPDKTFEHSVDSLRDFIIALDKEKADRLRYKVEDDVVRIFITPYKTIISEKDLKFSQGDFNVELIIALGVEKREDLDAAITAHGRILHDATVVTVNQGIGKPTLGSFDWTDTGASSLCEMLMSLSESLQSGLLDEQIATAVLTGIVAATDRFRNEHTSPRVMTMAAQLMAAGANQQLIAAKLEEGRELPAESRQDEDGSTQLQEGRSQKLNKQQKPEKDADDGSLEVSHAEASASAPAPEPAPDTEALKQAEDELARSLAAATPTAPTLSVEDLKSDLAAASKELEEEAPSDTEDPAESPVQAEEPANETSEPSEQVQSPADDQEPKIIKQGRRSWQTEPSDKPSFGGTLNATVSEAEEAKLKEEEAKRSQKLLSHDDGSEQVNTMPETEATAPEIVPETPDVPPVPTFVPPPEAEKPLESTSDEALSFEPMPINGTTDQGTGTTLAELDEQTRGKAAEDARAAIDAALSAMPFDPAGKPLESAGAMPALDLDHGTQPDPVAPVLPEQPQVVPSAPPLPPLPDFSTLPPLPGEEPVSQPFGPDVALPPENADVPVAPLSEPEPAPQPQPADPGQFKIPGQS